MGAANKAMKMGVMSEHMCLLAPLSITTLTTIQHKQLSGTL